MADPLVVVQQGERYGLTVVTLDDESARLLACADMHGVADYQRMVAIRVLICDQLAEHFASEAMS